MRVSKEKRAETRRALVNAAVTLFSERGIDGTSMREVANRAGVAAGTAYKYFPQREQLFYAYFELKQDDAQAMLKQLPGVDEFNFKENLQAYVESILAEYVADREFVGVAMRMMMGSPLQAMGGLKPIKRKVAMWVSDIFQQAIEDGELQEGPFQDFLVSAFWDYTNLIVMYWLEDDSEGFTRTSELIDITLDLYVATVKSGLVDRAARVLEFVVKSHIYGNWDHLTTLLTHLGTKNDHPAEKS